MPITWQFEIKKVIDENEEGFWSSTFEADTIGEAKEKAENIIREQRNSLHPRPDSNKWVLDDENNCIFRGYYQQSSVFRDDMNVYHLPQFRAIVEPLDVSLSDISDYCEDMQHEGI